MGVPTLSAGNLRTLERHQSIVFLQLARLPVGFVIRVCKNWIRMVGNGAEAEICVSQLKNSQPQARKFGLSAPKPWLARLQPGAPVVLASGLQPDSRVYRWFGWLCV